MPITTHTPAPWRFVLNAAFSDGQPSASVWIEAGEYRSLATLIPVAEVEANARLIAAAPDLLAACEKFVESFKSLQREKCDVAHRMAVEAIAKAEGSL